MRQRREIWRLQRVGLKTASAEALLDRMLITVDRICEQRDATHVLIPMAITDREPACAGSIVAADATGRIHAAHSDGARK
jgi:hypothetical protein